jgi:hypothetical protein
MGHKSVEEVNDLMDEDDEMIDVYNLPKPAAEDSSIIQMDEFEEDVSVEVVSKRNQQGAPRTLTEAEKKRLLERECNLRIGYQAPNEAGEIEEESGSNGHSSNKKKKKHAPKRDHPPTGTSSALKQTTLAFPNNLVGQKRGAGQSDYDYTTKDME